MKLSRWILVGSLVALILLIATTFVFNLPLGPHLTASAAGLSSDSAKNNNTVSDVLAAVATSAPSLVSGNCGQTGRMSILFLGENLPNTPWHGADAIRLLRADFDQNTVDVLSLPPELWVDTPILKDFRVRSTTLTMVYFLGKQADNLSDRDKMVQATEFFAQTLNFNFGYVPYHYITVNQTVYRDMIDKLGGLHIDLPKDVDGTPEQFGYFKAGSQVLSGQQVLNYVRIMMPANDADHREARRIERQNQVLLALFAQLASPDSLKLVPGMIQQFQQDVVTDLSANQLTALGCLLSDRTVKVNQVDVPGDLIMLGRNSVLLPLTPNLGQFIKTTVGQ